MAKLVKPLLIVAAIAVNVIPGVGTVLSAAMITSITAAGVTAGLGMAASALGLGPKSPAVSPATRERLYASIDPATPRKVVFGETALATDIRYQEWNGTNQEYLDQIVCLASHRITDVQEIWLDDKLAWTPSGAQGEFAGYLTVDVRTEGTAANYVVIAAGAKWGAARRMTGLAYLRMRFKVTGNDKKKESPFAQNIPTRLTVIGRAMPVYDPRFDSTRGGSGTMRADDQTTWAFTYAGVEVGRNPSNQLLSYLLGWRINGKLAVGRGLPSKRLDFDSFITAANACDEPVALAGGGTEPRYRTDGIFSESDDPRGVIDSYETSMNAKLRDAGGRFALTVISNDLATPRFNFDDNDVMGEFRWTPAQDPDKVFNEIRGKFTNPSRAALFQLVDYPRFRVVPIDGIERVHPLDLPLVQSGSQAQRLAKQQFARNQYQGRFECSLGPRGWAVQLGDVVTLTFSTLGWAQRVFRVVEHGMRFDGVCPVVLQEENANIYLWDSDERPIPAPVQPVPYDAMKSTLMQMLVAGEIEYADGFSLEYFKPATTDATKGAPDGTLVSDMPAEDVVDNIEAQAIAANYLLEASITAEISRLRDRALFYPGPEGEYLYTLHVREVTERTTADAAFAETFALLGAYNGDNTAFVLNTATVFVDEEKSLAITLDEIDTKFGDYEASISYINGVLANESGAVAHALLRVTVDGLVVGWDAYNDGEQGIFTIATTSFRLVDPVTGVMFLGIDTDGILKAKGIEVDTIALGAVGRAQMARAAGAKTSFASSQVDINCPNGVPTTLVSYTFVKEDADSILELLGFAQCYNYDDMRFYANLLIDGSPVQQARTNLILDNPASLSEMPISPWTLKTGISAGEHTVSFQLNSFETEAATIVRAGAMLKVTELRKATIGDTYGTAAPVAVPPTDPGDPGGGEYGGGDGGFCVTIDTPILMGDGTESPAESVAAGVLLRTQHHHTRAWGEYPVSNVEFASAEVYRAVIDGKVLRATADHKVWTGNRWQRMHQLGEPDGRAIVARISVADAQTYVSNGILSHNLKA